MKDLQPIPTNAKFYISKNFGNDVNGNPRIYFEFYNEEMDYLGFCQDNYAGTNFCYGRNLKSIGSYSGIQKGIKEYKQSLRGCTEFKNELLK